mgnify:CR=1 FL=1
MGLLDERVDHRLGVLALDPGEQHIAAMTFHQGCDLAVLATEQEITLPMTRYRTILSFSGAFADRDDVSDLTTVCCLVRVVS